MNTDDLEELSQKLFATIEQLLVKQGLKHDEAIVVATELPEGGLKVHVIPRKELVVEKGWVKVIVLHGDTISHTEMKPTPEKMD